MFDHERKLYEEKSKSGQEMIISEVVIGDHGLETLMVEKSNWIRECCKV